MFVQASAHLCIHGTFRLSLLEEFDCSCNELESLPPTIGYLHNLRTFAADENFLSELPREASGQLAEDRRADDGAKLCVIARYITLALRWHRHGGPPSWDMPAPEAPARAAGTWPDHDGFSCPSAQERDTIGSCKNVTVMSLRSNKLEFLPEEIGQMTKLRVLNLSDNSVNAPMSAPSRYRRFIARKTLRDTQANGAGAGQGVTLTPLQPPHSDLRGVPSKALIPLQTEAHPETKQRVLTNYMFPQQPRHDEDYQSDSDSFNPTLWEEQRQQRMTVAFEFEDKKEEEDNSGKVKVEINLKRYPTPYPEDLKNMVKSVQNLVGKTGHPLSTEKCSSGTNMELPGKEKFEPKWPIAPKEVAEREAKDFSKGQMTEQVPMHNSAMDIQKRKDKEDLTESSEVGLKPVGNGELWRISMTGGKQRRRGGKHGSFSKDLMREGRKGELEHR
ncbi:hypothetical protein JZ751_024769 [Albula glossodonta]|uniref:Leucine-rich repeat-containing protein 7 n=1 Tax=Albula glossodonta TaxID=121402 RepID=A0A8T2PFH7_9TELE|nr:hypothetical protein JZ751_024769 [Albula glossodonta]